MRLDGDHRSQWVNRNITNSLSIECYIDPHGLLGAALPGRMEAGLAIFDPESLNMQIIVMLIRPFKMVWN
jgi:hypothetical protein